MIDVTNLDYMNLNFETLTDMDLSEALGGKSVAYNVGYYTGKIVQIGLLLVPLI
ncbi:TPA: hypothetical protein ACJ51Y_002295 [Streptococcus suis]